MIETGILRHQLTHETRHIAFHIGIGAFVHCECASGMHRPQMSDAILDATLRNQLPDFIRYIDELFTRARPDFYPMCHCQAGRSSCTVMCEMPNLSRMAEWICCNTRWF